MRAHLVQYDIAWEDKPANHALVRETLMGVDVSAGDLVVLPEMFDTGFSMNTETTTRDPGASLAFLSALARERGVYVLASIPVCEPEAGDGRDYLNRAVLVEPTGEVAATTDKLHPFSFGREAERFRGGDRVAVCRLGGDDGPLLCPVICYDLRFPEVFRLGVDRGAEVFAVIANWPSARQTHWRTLCIARAIEQQAIVLGLNRCGSDPKLSYLGGSIVVNEQGEVLAEAGSTRAVLSVRLDLDRVRAWRRTFPALRDRRYWDIGPTDADPSGQEKSGKSSG